MLIFAKIQNCIERQMTEYNVAQGIMATPRVNNKLKENINLYTPYHNEGKYN